jgi:hypothetical protein
MVATVLPNWSLAGRITEQSGKFPLMNSHGTGKIMLGWKSGVPGVRKKLGNFRPWSETGATGGWTPLPEKSTQIRPRLILRRQMNLSRKREQSFRWISGLHSSEVAKLR